MGDKWVELEKILSFNKDLYDKEPRTGKREEFFDELGGLEALEGLLQTDLRNGLPASEAAERESGTGLDKPYARRIAHFGDNQMPERKKRTFIAMVWDKCSDPIIGILAAAAIVSLALGVSFPETYFDADCHCTQTDNSGWVEGVAIVVAIMVVVLVGAGQDYDKERKFRALGKVDIRRITVMRAGAEQEVRADEVLVGDVVLLEQGRTVPADGYLIASDELKIDEASVTGEAEPVAKNKRDPLLLANTFVSVGSGRMLVGATGKHTTWGKTLSGLQEDEGEDTPLQIDLAKMVISIGFLGVFFGVATFYLLAMYWAIDVATLIDSTAWHDSYIRPLIDALIIGITVVVVAIPEGLPLAVIISLAYSMKAMTKDNNLVRHLEACETMGGATNICSDKTGTLTQNKMTVMEAWLGGTQLGQLPNGWRPASAHYWELLHEGIALNSTALRQEEMQDGKPLGKTKVVGMPTEMALLDYMDKVGGTTDYYTALRRDKETLRVLKVPFSSETKRMTSIYYDEASRLLRVYVKGAPDRLIADTTHVMMSDGSVVECTPELRRQLQDLYVEFGRKAYRTLLVGYAEHACERFIVRPDAPVNGGRFRVELKSEPLERRIVTQAIFGVEDPVRPEVPEAVRQCLNAGITVRMVTGDVAETATKIAEQCGIKTKKGIVITGQEFRGMTDDQVDRIIPQLQVMARSQPADKLRLVNRLRALNQVVAVTGDGTNDAPALKAADVGLAMGLTGTDVAKEACDIIIMDDNFKSIVQSVKWGRNVYEGVRKFITFQLTVNLVALSLVFIGAVSRYGAPLRAVQLLWVNLIMDTLAALALATEPPTDELLLQKPHGKTERLISNIMWKHIVGQGLLQLGATLACLYAAYLIPWTRGRIANGSRAHYTIVFNVFVWLQLFNELNARSIDDHQNIFKGLLQSPIFIGVLVVSAGLQAIIVEFGSSAFKCTGLSWDQWLFCIAVGFISIPLGFVLRALPVPERHFVDILQFWNRPPVLRHVERSVDEFEGQDFELVSASLLPYDRALEENRAALAHRKENEKAQRETKRQELVEMRQREEIERQKKAEQNDLK